MSIKSKVKKTDPRVSDTTQRETFDLEKLKNKEVLSGYQAKVSALLGEQSYESATTDEPQRAIEQKWQHIKSAVTVAAKTCIGRANRQPDKPWFDTTCGEKVEIVRIARKECIGLHNNTVEKRTNSRERDELVKLVKQKKKIH
ncbi:hypothetical protein QAD02_012328 [Eretmocerus hayati]|uniref:Uncharacterized protein n=1 Tax=Eretmocerus hayati TaxID=131215 RepID=A0ACC2P136_9HYME|nr:hypothetical protein QAD02_012328 [Eretmocerus hayati]